MKCQLDELLQGWMEDLSDLTSGGKQRVSPEKYVIHGFIGLLHTKIKDQKYNKPI